MMGGTGLRPWLILCLLAGSLLRVAFVGHPADYQTLAPWREADYAQIARSFYREDPNILYPRVDFRGDTPGFVEMELPIVPWIAALLYHVFGYHEEILRVLSAACGLLALVAFARLASEVLPRAGAGVAIGAYACNGLAISLSGSIQPDSCLLLFTNLAALWVFRWLRSDSRRDMLTACAVLSLAILVKSPAAHLGLLIAWFVLKTRGVKALRTPGIVAAAALALAAPIAWYAWARGHYESTSLSLGLSTESHWINWDVIRHPKNPVINNLVAEVRDAFSYTGVLLAAGVVLRSWRRVEPLAVWYGSILVFYALTANTSGDGWAYYYHANSIAPASLLIGSGFAAWHGLARRRARCGRVGSVAAGVAAITLCAGLWRGLELNYGSFRQPALREMYECFPRLAEHVPPDGMIVVRGGDRYDHFGYPVDYFQSMAFTWMDRKGFIYSRDDFDLAELRAIAGRGGRYWLAGPEDLGDARFRVQGLGERFRLLATCGNWRLYDLAE